MDERPGSSTSSEPNPFAAPRSERLRAETPEPPEPPADPEAERIRRAHIRLETSIRTMGFLGWLLGGFALFAASVALYGAIRWPGPAGGAGGERVWYGLIAGLLGGGSFALGAGLRGLRAWARWPSAVVAGLALLAGVGLWLASLFGLVPARWVAIAWVVDGLPAAHLWWMLSPGASVVFSERYAEVVRLTPHIRYIEFDGLPGPRP